MLRQLLRQRGPLAAAAAAGRPAAPTAACTLLPGQSARRVHGGTGWQWPTKEDALSSGRAPTSTPPDNPTESTDDFQRLADLYLGGLWEKVESGLRAAQDQGKEDFDVQLEHDKMRMTLPEGGRIIITKDPDGRALVVTTNLHDMYGSDGADSEVPFRLQRDHTWEQGGEELHEFLEDNLAKHLKVQVDLEPDTQTIYGPDPT